MAFVVADRVLETGTVGTGTGPVNLGGAVSGYQSFVGAVGSGNTTYYAIYDASAYTWEVGIGTVTSGTPNTLSRTTVIASSNSGSLVSFSTSNTLSVFCTYPAEKAVYSNSTVLVAPSGALLPVGNGGTGLGTLTGANNALYSTSSSALAAGTLPIAAGGTGVTTTPTNGQLLVGNGTNYTVATLGSGTGISTTTGAGTLTVNNTGVTSNVAGTGVSVSGATGAVTISIGQAVATSSNVQFNSLGVGTAGSGTTGEIRATNNVTAYYSDGRLKDRIGTIENALSKVKQLTGFLYKNNDVAKSFGYTSDEIQVGLDAQEVEKVQPEVVAPAPFDIGQNEDGTEFSKSGENYLTVRYERLIPLLVEAIKDLSNELDEIKAKL